MWIHRHTTGSSLSEFVVDNADEYTIESAPIVNCAVVVRTTSEKDRPNAMVNGGFGTGSKSVGKTWRVPQEWPSSEGLRLIYYERRYSIFFG